MNSKQLMLIVLALAILGGASLVLLKHNDQSWSSPQGELGQKLYPDFPMNDISGLDIQGADEVHLDRKGDIWRVRERNDYPADFSKIRTLLMSLSSLKISQSEPIGLSQLAHMELEQPGKGKTEGTGTLVTFVDDKGKTVPSLLLGKKHLEDSASPSPFGGGGYANGRYVMRLDDPKRLLLITDPMNNVEFIPAPWLEEDFFKIDKPSAITVVSTNTTNSWALSRSSETAPWVLADPGTGEILDSNKASSLSSTFSYTSFVDVASNTAPAQTGLDKPVTVKISTFDHFDYDIKIGAKTPEDNYYLTVTVSANLPSARTPGKDEKPEDKAKLDKDFETQNKAQQAKFTQEKSLGQWVYLVSTTQLEPVMRTRAELMVDKKSDTSDTNAPASSSDLKDGDSGQPPPALVTPDLFK